MEIIGVLTLYLLIYFRKTGKLKIKTGYILINIFEYSTFIIFLWSSTAWINGKKSAILVNVFPNNSISNQIPDNQAVKFVNKAPHIPPTCFTFNMLPKSNPKDM